MKKAKAGSGLGAEIDIGIALLCAQKALIKKMEKKKPDMADAWVIKYLRGQVDAHTEDLKIVRAYAKKGVKESG